MTNGIWKNTHEDVPTDDDGRPIHPEKGFPICGMEKTDASDESKRDDIPYCLRRAGWGTDRPTDRGGACRLHGGAGGAPEGWRNGNARHLLYSKRMSDDDREEFDALVETADGNRIGVDEMAEMLENMVGFEYMRLSRAVGEVPAVSSVTIASCPQCGESYRVDGNDPTPTVDRCHGESNDSDGPCGYAGELEIVPGKSFVDFGDKAVERKEAKLSNLIKTYKEISEGRDVNIDGDFSHDGSMSVSITSVGVDLPDEVEDE